MKQTTNAQGQVTLTLNLRQTAILITALQERHHKLLKGAISPQTCDQILGMISELSYSQVQARQALTLYAKRDDITPPAQHRSRTRWYDRVTDFFCPRLSIASMEQCAGASGDLIFLKSMLIDPRGPYHVDGSVRRDLDQRWMKASWSAHGHCSCPEMGEDQFIFDLTHPDKSEVHSGMLIGFAAVAVVIFAALAYSLNYLL
jgi:hypothetical protein